MTQAWFRFYEELNDFLPPDRRKTTFPYHFTGTPSVKDAIEAIGIPHAEIDLILVNGASVTFGHHLADGNRVAVYPVFELLDIASVTRLRPEPLREPKFILDVHLGKLARYLRLLGFNTDFRNDADDPEIIARATDEHRIILTRDVGILKHAAVTHGYWVRTTDPRAQIGEVIRRFNLQGQIRPFTRCMVCNGQVAPVPKTAVVDRLPEKTRRYYDAFTQCNTCGRIYWKGSHYERMKHLVAHITGDLDHP